MNYYISETQVDESQTRTAGSKARNDVETIFKEKKIIPIYVAVMQKDRKKSKITQKIQIHQQIYKEWVAKTKELSKGDVLFIQFPCLEHTLFLKNLLTDLKKRGVKTVLLIHDLEMLRISKEKNTKLKKKIRLRIEEYSCLKNAGVVISHNPSMTDYLISIGIAKERIVTLEIFDYLIPAFTPRKTGDRNRVIIAGNLESRKAGYVYELPNTVKFELYGVNYTGTQNEMITFHGSYPSDELPNVMEGGFGLVWDGTSSKTCEGIYGSYLKINNPHKTSLYLASGLPVLIWKQAALADFVVENHCGLLIDSLDDIPMILNSLSQMDYSSLKRGAEEISQLLRNGAFTKKALMYCLNNEVVS